jgi:hypothetical protein
MSAESFALTMNLQEGTARVCSTACSGRGSRCTLLRLETARLAASKRSGASSSTSPACASADSYRPTKVELIEQLLGRGDRGSSCWRSPVDKDDARWGELRCRSETAQTLGVRL